MRIRAADREPVRGTGTRAADRMVGAENPVARHIREEWGHKADGDRAEPTAAIRRVDVDLPKAAVHLAEPAHIHMVVASLPRPSRSSTALTKI